MADRLVVRGAREHNLRGVDLDLPRDSLVVFTGLSGFGQVEPRVRHDLRRGPAAVRRVAVGLRAAVPRPDGQARRRLHRGPLARGLDRPEVHQPQPALHGRHDHRGLRLPAAALRPGGRAALPGLRARDREADAAADRRPGAGDGGGQPVPGARARSCAAARASSSTCSPTCRRRATRACSVDGTVHPLTDPPKLKKQEKHDISVVVDRLTVKPSAKQRLTDSVETALRLADGLVVLEFVDLPEDDHAPGAPLLRAHGLPQRPPAQRSTTSSRARSPSTRPTAPARSARAWASRRRSTRSWSCPTPS